LECAAERRHYVFFVGEEGGPRFWRVQSNLVFVHTTDDYEDFLEKSGIPFEQAKAALERLGPCPG